MLYLSEILYSQGFGSRREVAELIACGQLYLKKSDAVWQLQLTDELLDEYEIAWKVGATGAEWQWRHKVYLALYKPAGYECSLRPARHAGVHSLLPAPLLNRPNRGKANGVQPVGRLDQDTTGLLLFSDDGDFIHRLSSPKKHIAKVYEVDTAAPITAVQLRQLLDGVVLRDSAKAVVAQSCVQLAEQRLKLTLTQGKYHQVKRMLAAVGNRVVALHRTQVGKLLLPPHLAPGQWCYIAKDSV